LLEEAVLINEKLPHHISFTYRGLLAEAEDCAMMNQDCWLVEPASHQILALCVVV